PRQSLSFKNHLTLGRAVQTQDCLCQTAFATAALANDCDSLPALQLKAHPVHGAYEPGASENPTPELKLRGQVSDGEKGLLLRSGFHSSCFQRSAIFFENGVLRIEDRDLQSSLFDPQALSSYSQHFTCRPSFDAIRGGSLSQRSKRHGQRGAKGRPPRGVLKPGASTRV